MGQTDKKAFEEGQRVQQIKFSDYNNQNEDDSLSTSVDDNSKLLYFERWIANKGGFPIDIKAVISNDSVSLRDTLDCLNIWYDVSGSMNLSTSGAQLLCLMTYQLLRFI